MKIRVLQENLKTALEMVMRAVDKKHILPVLQNFHLKVDGAWLIISGTDLQQWISVRVSAKVDEEGSITLPAKTLSDLVKIMSPDQVEFTVNYPTQTATIRYGAACTNLKGIDANEFPKAPQLVRADLKLDAEPFQKALKSLVKFAAGNDNRPILTGVCMDIHADHIDMATANGYALAVTQIPVSDVAESVVGKQIIIPAAFLTELSKAFENEVLEVQIEPDHFQIASRNVTVSIMRLEGKYPDYTAIVPRQMDCEAQVDPADFLKALKGASSVAGQDVKGFTPVTLSFNPDAKAVTVSANSAERGEFSAPITAVITGNPVELLLNRQLLNFIAEEEEPLTLGATSAKMPLKVATSKTTWVVMPMGVK